LKLKRWVSRKTFKRRMPNRKLVGSRNEPALEMDHVRVVLSPVMGGGGLFPTHDRMGIMQDHWVVCDGPHSHNSDRVDAARGGRNRRVFATSREGAKALSARPRLNYTKGDGSGKEDIGQVIGGQP
jgi:hypothetical protein